MPRIFDNIENKLLSSLSDSLEVSYRSDFCVGYFNLRGWRTIDNLVEKYTGDEGNCCRLLIGMQKLPQDELRDLYSLRQSEEELDNQTALRLKKKLAEEFKEQLTYGVPTNEDEKGLRKLSAQIKSKKVVIKLFLRHSLHAKLYLVHRKDNFNPIIGYLGSSNLTLPGLSKQGELNVDILDEDAGKKLCKWFNERWEDKWCIDISKELADIIDNSWAREDVLPPYYIYLKMAYHLSMEARAGLAEFKIPKDFKHKLLDFQIKAVQIAAHHLNKRGGVLIGDVVGLGKTLMATALARIFEDDMNIETLILCSKNLVPMWEQYVFDYRLRAKVMKISVVQTELQKLRRYRQVIIDESHNLRNREGKRYRAILEYLRENESKVIMLTATPYNKTYLDLSNQLRLFIPEEIDIGIRPEKLITEITETQFLKQFQCSPRSLKAFEHSQYADDWRDLMRLYLVRRTRSFIKDNYALTDDKNGKKYLLFDDGTHSTFPDRIPKNKKFTINDNDPADQYAGLYSAKVVDTINGLKLPRYGLGNFIKSDPEHPPTTDEAKTIKDLSRAGKRLMGFSRTNLFKRLESSGWAFLVSVNRHILRNFIFIYAIENNLPLPIGTQDPNFLDPEYYDDDFENNTLFNDDDDDNMFEKDTRAFMHSQEEYYEKAKETYKFYSSILTRKFKWLPANLFVTGLSKTLRNDGDALIKILNECGDWNVKTDMKLSALVELCTKNHPDDKVLIFSQYADTVLYLAKELKNRKIKNIAGVTGNNENPTEFAGRFSPYSNNKKDVYKPDEEIRVLVSTDVLSEGQNLQDCNIVVNFDLPWTIIRLIQRAGRVDRIGQAADKIICYSFMPVEGVDKIINLRDRVAKRLKENEEVIGTDELFFEGEKEKVMLKNLYNEKGGILDGEDSGEVDLGSLAYQIWKNALDKDSKLNNIIPSLDNVVFSTKEHTEALGSPQGVLVYTKTGESNDVLTWIDQKGSIATQSQLAILKAAECNPETAAIHRNENHHKLVEIGIKNILDEERTVGGQLGRPSGARFRTYERLKKYLTIMKGSLFDTPELNKAIEEIYRYPIKQLAIDTLNRQLKSGINDAELAQLVISLREDGSLGIISDEIEYKDPKIICSMGLFSK